MALAAVPLGWALLRIATIDMPDPANVEHAAALVTVGALPDEPTGAHQTGAEAAPLPSDRLSDEPVIRDLRRFAAIRLAPGSAISRARSIPAQSPNEAVVSGLDATGRVNPPLVAPSLARSGPSAPGIRWHADAWLVLREGSERTQTLGTILPRYGSSQAGAVLRYDLVPGSRHRPAAYARAAHALGPARESDIAAGLSARPLPALPLAAHLEMRAGLRSDRVEIRPAAFLTTGADDVALPFGALAHGYGQAGYVGGRDGTAFVDGSINVEWPLARRGESAVAVGAGSWAGAQRGSARLDVGPSASLRFKLGDGYGRLAIDYRLRVAGNAVPGSGAALTLAAGF